MKNAVPIRIRIMQAHSDGEKYLLRFDRGEEVMTMLLMWARDKKLPGASLTGLGAVENPHLGYFDAEKKGYLDKEFEGEFEIASLCGNLAWDSETGNPIAHMHVVISGLNFMALLIVKMIRRLSQI